jgi:SET domain-containing protein
VFALKDIKQGDELVIDYCCGETDQKKRDEMLKKYGIDEK